MTPSPTPSPSGFTVRPVPGGTSASTPYALSYSASGPGGNDQGRQENVRESTASRHMIFGLIEIVAGLLSNIGQTATTFFSFIQIQLGVKDTTFSQYGPLGGMGTVMTTHPVFVWVSLAIAIGAQILLQAGCQVLSHAWKQEQRAEQQDHQRYGVVRVLLSQEAGWFFTGLGFVLDAVGDLGFAIAFGIPWYVCVLFGLMMNGLSTVVLYDGDERFHYAYPIWWKMWKARKVWAQAALEQARLMHGVSPDGRSLISH